MRAASLYCSACRKAINANVYDFAPPRPPPRNTSYASGTARTLCWNGERVSESAIGPRTDQLRVVGRIQRAGKRERDGDRVLLRHIGKFSVTVSALQEKEE